MLCHIEAEWSTVLIEDGQAFVHHHPGAGIGMMQLLFAISWDIPVKVYFSLCNSLYSDYLYLFQPLGAEASCCNNRYRVGPDRQPVVRDYFHCRGNEQNLSQCPRSLGSNCGHDRDVSVICS